MRFIVREQSYEKPIAAGLLRLEREGVPTGAVESWRLTTAVSGYQILRVDCDNRETETGDSFLFHLVQQESGQPERLGYRYWGQGMMIEGTALFTDGHINARRNINGRTVEEEIKIDDGFWFPSNIGYGIASQLSQKPMFNTATLSKQPINENSLTLQQTQLTQNQQSKQVGQTIGQKTVQTKPTTIMWHLFEKTVFIEQNHQWPTKIVHEDGLTAVETRYIWYGT